MPTEFIGQLLQIVATQMSPEIRERLVSFVNDLETEAEATPNPYDNVGIDALKTILAVEEA